APPRFHLAIVEPHFRHERARVGARARRHQKKTCSNDRARVRGARAAKKMSADRERHFRNSCLRYRERREKDKKNATSTPDDSIIFAETSILDVRIWRSLCRTRDQLVAASLVCVGSFAIWRTRAEFDPRETDATVRSANGKASALRAVTQIAADDHGRRS